MISLHYFSPLYFGAQACRLTGDICAGISESTRRCYIKRLLCRDKLLYDYAPTFTLLQTAIITTLFAYRILTLDTRYATSEFHCRAHNVDAIHMN